MQCLADLQGFPFQVKPHGLRGHTYWLTSPDFELIVGKSEEFPPVLVQLHSAYIHSVGIDWALDLMEGLLRHEVFAGAYRLNVSRIDIYADFQGWEPRVTDLDRFVSFSRHRRGFQENQQVYMTGPRLTGSCSARATWRTNLRQDRGDPAARRELASRSMGFGLRR